MARHPAPLEQETASRAVASVAVAQQGGTHALPTTPDGTPPLRHGVAADRRSRIDDAERRHGRQSWQSPVDGDKRQGRRALAARLIVAVGVTPAHAPEASVTDAIATDWAAPQGTLRAWPMDRASLASQLVQQRSETLPIFCQAWPVRQGPYCPTTAFQLDWECHALRVSWWREHALDTRRGRQGPRRHVCQLCVAGPRDRQRRGPPYQHAAR